MAETNPRVFFDFSIQSGPPKRVIFELFKDVVPITAENFRALCTGEKGSSTLSPDKPLCYKGSVVHRIVPSFMIQGGDIIQNNGKSGESIYGGEFADENFKLNCDREGLLVMANKGPNTNQSQWFITLAPAEHLNGKHVVFGRVQSGFDVVQEISKLETDPKKHRPLGGIDVVQIVHCGQLERRQKSTAIAKSADQASSQPTKRPPRSSRSPSLSASDEGSSAFTSSESSSAARRRRRRKKKEKKKAARQSSKTKRLKFKGQEDGDTDQPPAREELVLKQLELEHQEAESRRKQEEDAMRLEEEKRRKAQALEILRSKHEKKDGAIIFKGRGSMRYRDSDASFGTRAWDN